METNTNKQTKVHSCLVVPIVGINYKTKNKTTICRIRWVNPLNGNIQVSHGIATCNPEDNFDNKIGERLAESRAKIKMYCDYFDSFICHENMLDKKVDELIERERRHQNKINPSKNHKNNKENE